MQEEELDTTSLADETEDGYELPTEETEDLDDAMREALEAVERSETLAAQAEAAVDRPRSGDDTDELGPLKAELAELRDRSVRTLADFDNYRKRVARERREERRYASLELIADILAVVDNLERALASEGSIDDLKQGVDMIHRQTLDVLRRHGAEPVPSLGEAFDPSVHDAVSRHEDPTVDQPTVREEMRRGYRLHDRLVRPAMVTVAMPVDDDGPDAGLGSVGEPSR